MPFNTQTSKSPTLAKCGLDFEKLPKFRLKGGGDVNLSKELSGLKMGDVVEYWTEGKFSLHNLIEGIINITGPATVMIVTWAMTEAPLRTLARLKREGKITQLYCLLEHKVTGHNSKSYGYALQIFDEIQLARCHAKVVLIENEDWAVSITTSANLTRNRRIECGDIKCLRESVDFHKKWIMDKWRQI